MTKRQNQEGNQEREPSETTKRENHSAFILEGRDARDETPDEIRSFFAYSSRASPTKLSPLCPSLYHPSESLESTQTEGEREADGELQKRAHEQGREECARTSELRSEGLLSRGSKLLDRPGGFFDLLLRSV